MESDRIDFVKVWLRLYKKQFEEIQQKANQESIESDPNDKSMKDELLFNRAEIRLDEIYVAEKSDEIELRGQLWAFGNEIGWVDFNIPFNQEMAKDIIEKYIKKLQKLKTILEATKD